MTNRGGSRKNRGSWVRGPRKARLAPQPVDHGRWNPYAHPAPTVAECFVLDALEPSQDGYMILRRAGEGYYTLARTTGAVLDQGGLEGLKERGEAMEDQEAAQDVQVTDQGSIVLFRPLTEAGRSWIDEHVQEDAQWFGGALVCEQRFAGDLMAGMEGDGLRL